VAQVRCAVDWSSKVAVRARLALQQRGLLPARVAAAAAAAAAVGNK